MQRGWAFAIVAGLITLESAAHADNAAIAQCMDAHENAQRAQKNGHLNFAQKLFQECLVPTCPTALRNDCIEGAASVEHAMPTVTIVVREASGTDVPSTIKVDDTAFSAEPGKAVPMDPGPHKVTYTVGDETMLASFTLVEGEKSRVIVLPATTETPAPTARPAAPPPPKAVEEPPSRGYIIGPALVCGLGVLTLITSIGAFAASRGEANDRDELLAIAANPALPATERNNANLSARSHDSAAGSDRTISLVLGASALVLMGGAVAWYFVAKPASRRASWFSPVITF